MSFANLIGEARELGIDVAEFQALVKFGEEVATIALKKAIGIRKKAIALVDHKGLFSEQYGDDLAALMQQLMTVRQALQDYNALHETRLNLNLEAEELEDLISDRQRAPRSRVERDVEGFVRRMRAAGYALRIRTKPARDEAFVYGEMTAAGGVHTEAQDYRTLNAWISAVYASAKERGQRSTTASNAWESVQVQYRDGAYVTLETAYREMMQDIAADVADADAEAVETDEAEAVADKAAPATRKRRSAA